MTGGTVTGYTAIYAKAGQIKITGGNLLATGEEYHQPVVNYNNGFKNPTGDAIVLHSCSYGGGTPSLVISGC